MIEHFCTTLERLPDAVAEHLGTVLVASVGALTAAYTKRKALFGDLANLLKIAESIEQIQQTCVGCPKPALKGIGRRFEQLGDLFRILKLPRSEHDKADIVTPATAGASGHLLQFACGQCTPAVVAPRVGIGDYNRPGRKINTSVPGPGRNED